eukprot:COSAG01_NODE_4783_length_4747_cov_3.078959_3_plen_340_part_00
MGRCSCFGIPARRACGLWRCEMMPLPTHLVVTLLVSCPVAALASRAVSDITLLPLSTGAAALDGSAYGFYFVRYAGDIAAHRNRWTISIMGGGWCVGVTSCFARSQETTHDGKPGSLGSSTPWVGQKHGCSCMNTNATHVETEGCNCIQMLYLDGGSFSGNVAEPVPVPGEPGKFVHYRGLRNLDATLEYAFAHLGLGLATEVVVTGGSAGGLSTFLHVDRIAQRVKAGAKDCQVVTAAPVVGFFLDHAIFRQMHSPPHHAATSHLLELAQPGQRIVPQMGYPHSGNYSSWMQTVYADQNITAALLPRCLATYADTPHLCFMSPHMVAFITTPFFLFNS